MKKMISLVKFWTYSLTYGPNPATQPFSLKHINGSGLGGSYYDSLMTSWLTSRTKLTQWFSSAYSTTRSYFRHYPGRHRDPLTARQTYAGRTAIRAQREAAWHNWQAFLDMRVPETVGVATFPATGSRAYRRLSPSVLNRETKALIRAHVSKDWLD